MILATSQKLQATVAVVGKTKTNQYGDYQPVLFEGERLPEGKLWRSMPPAEAQQLRRGQLVYLIPRTGKAGQPRYDVEVIDAEPSEASLQRFKPLSSEQKNEIARYIEAMGDLWGYCYATAHQKLDEEASEQAIRAMTSSLFIAAQRRFDLA